MVVGALLFGGGTLLAAEIATWRFDAAAKGERNRRGDFIGRERDERYAAVRRERDERYEAVRRERAERREIERETRRRLAQEARERRGAWLDALTESMNAVWRMRNDAKRIRSQFLEIVKANERSLRNSSLTFQQPEAVRDCIGRLQRGIERLDAYAGPYLESHVSAIKDAKKAALRDDFVEPALPEPTLPDDFPVVGDNLRLSSEETASLLSRGEVALGCGEVGCLTEVMRPAGLVGEADAFVTEFDRDSDRWTLSLARGAVASAVAAEIASPLEATLLSPSKGGFRAVWHSPYAESVELFMPFSLADPTLRSAPWGTRLPVYVQHADYRLRRIIVGQRPAEPPDDRGDVLVAEAPSASVRDAIKRGLAVSGSTFWLYRNLQNGPRTDGELLMRTATREEFPVSCRGPQGVLRIGEQVGFRLGSADGPICRSDVGLRFADGVPQARTNGSLGAAAFLARVRQRLDEQEEIRRVFEEESLETRKYQLLLEAEIEAAQSEPRVVLRYSAYHGDDQGEDDPQEVTFRLEVSSPRLSARQVGGGPAGVPNPAADAARPGWRCPTGRRRSERSFRSPAGTSGF